MGLTYEQLEKTGGKPQGSKGSCCSPHTRHLGARESTAILPYDYEDPDLLDYYGFPLRQVEVNRRNEK